MEKHLINIESHLINGKILYYSFLAGANQIITHQIEMNEINVFPVNDKDTGTNLAATVQAILNDIKPYKSYKKTLDKIAKAALTGAKGNSGTIFAQFLYGLNCETKDKPSINASDFIESVQNSVPYIYKAVNNPTEGTMLTVIKDWCNYISNYKLQIKSLKGLLVNSYHILEKSLSETTQKLKILNKLGLVDAGAKGFVLFMKGVIDFIQTWNIRRLYLDIPQLASINPIAHATTDCINHRYCTEAMLRDLTVSPEEIQKRMDHYGDSLIVAGSRSMAKIHIHTNHPADLFGQLEGLGTVVSQKVDDMVRQNEVATHRKWNIALVTDSTCDLPQELIDHYQIHMLPMNLSFGNSFYLDKLTMTPNQFYDKLESSMFFPQTSQINEQTFANLYTQLASYYDAVVSIHLTGHFSGTFSNSCKAASKVSSECGKPIYAIDSKNLSGGLALLVLKAAQLIESGKQASEVVKCITNDIPKTQIFVSVRDLKYMIKGGRVRRPAGLIANLFHINPVISMDKQGNSCLFGKTFSQQASMDKIMKHLKKLMAQHSVWNYMILHAHCMEDAYQTALRMESLIGKKPLSVIDISPIIGMHAGQGAVAVSVMFN